MRKFFYLSILIIFINISITTATINPITDEANVLKSNELNLLNERISDIEKEYNIHLGIIFLETIGEYDMLKTSRLLREEIKGDILLLVAMNERKYEISIDSKLQEQMFDTEGVSFLKQEVQSSLSAGNYYEACNNFINGVVNLLNYYETNVGAYESDTRSFDMSAALISLVVSIFLGVFIRSVMINSMSNIRPAIEATDYLKRETFQLLEKRDIFLFTNVERHPKKNQNASQNNGGSF